MVSTAYRNDFLQQVSLSKTNLGFASPIAKQTPNWFLLNFCSQLTLSQDQLL
ncbi:hypothetical protein APA_5170 [Pseudanabaena sp. lw0831]|nr:hypothetical protein APA_5170 [Pseudanabaena sp. lw0831]